MPTLIQTISVALVCCLGTAKAEEAQLLPPTQAVAGRTQSEWSVLWWRWAWSFDRDNSPIADRTGQRCGAKQSGEVWFLAGTYGTRRTIRTCRIPAGKHLFFPLINYVVYPQPGNAPHCLSVLRQAAAVTDDVSALILDIDGVRHEALSSHRQAPSDCFDLKGIGEPPSELYPAAANGYYVMLRPLSPGRHELNFGGALPGMLQAVTYTLDVE